MNTSKGRSGKHVMKWKLGSKEKSFSEGDDRTEREEVIETLGEILGDEQSGYEDDEEGDDESEIMLKKRGEHARETRSEPKRQ